MHGDVMYLILNSFVSFLDFFLKPINVFLQRLDHPLEFVVFILLSLNLSFIIVDLFLKACKLKTWKN